MSAFRFSGAPFDTVALRESLADPAAGGFAAFEGWVRNHNEGKVVARLEYEAFEALAVKEGERIVEEARRRFPILQAACVHRIGPLDIGALAVWVGVSAPHRDEAFAACRYIIDEVKHRVPIWKKEHYLDGDSGWVNCERCATPEHEHARRPDYSRQIALKEVGATGQARLHASRVLVIGAGGLGVPVLSYLAGAGVGTLGIVDGDVLEASNLHRQPLYTLGDVGKLKAQLAAERLHALNPEVHCDIHTERFDVNNARRLVEQYDLAIDCSDNFATKFLLNDACLLARKPAVFASVYQYEGQLQTYHPDEESACLRCLWPEASRDGIVGTCAEAGVLGPVPGVFGSLQAVEALKILLGLPGQLHAELLIIDLTTFETRRIRAARAAACRGRQCTLITDVTRPSEATPADLELTFGSLDNALSAGYEIIDIREDNEVAREPAPDDRCRHIPMHNLLHDHAALDPERRYLLLCARGSRSRAAAAELRSHGLLRVFSLRGGIAAL
jgi:molybdopterin/thiamine biosynthesis adenylyltransferase/molybdopterin synthase catalytic subunit/rhodanese-related sulfurtransferase